MKIVNLSSILKNRLYLTIGLAILVGIVLITFAFIFVFNEKIEERNIKNNLFNLTSYYADYNVKVSSNKTISTHNIKEYYKKEAEKEFFRFDYKDFMQNDYCLVIKDGNAIMKNTMQIAKYITKVENKKENLYSLATYINIINENIFKVECETSEVMTTYNIYVKEVINEEALKKYVGISKNSLNIDKITLGIIANKPSYICIFSGENEIIKIEYLEFKQNEDMDLNVFEV